MLVWAYDGVKEGDEDQLPLEFVISLLSNGVETGLLDKLTIDGDVQFAGAFLDSRRDMGRIVIEAVPYYDVNQRMFDDNKTTEKIIRKEIDKLKNGEIEDWRIASVKKMYDEAVKLAFENSSSKMSALVHCFTYDQPLTSIFEENDKIQALTKEQIMATAKKFFNADHMTISFDEGSMKVSPLPKPKIQPLDPVKGAVTEYAKEFMQLPRGEVKLTYNNFADVQVHDLGDNVTLRYTPNNKNDIFTLTLRYGIGEDKMPMLPYVVALMNTAGVMPNTEAQEYNRQMAELGASVGYDCDDSYFYISISGEDKNLEKIMALVTRQLIMPKLEQKQLDNIIGSVFFSRWNRQKRNAAQRSALMQYALYGDKSSYIDEVKFGDIYALSLPKIQSLIAQAREYALDARYCGTRTPEEVAAALPLTEGMKPSTSPVIKDRKTYTKNTILFLPNNNVQQADLYLYINGRPYNIESDVVSDAFNQYFSGGFSGIVMNEIRTKRSMAYTAYGQDVTPIMQGKDCYFIGYVGSQSDKVVDVVKVYMDLLNNMPIDSTGIENIKIALRQSAQTAKPSMRGKAGTFAYWQRLGYQDDPARVNADKINNLTFSQIEQFYKENIQGKPVTLILMGDPKKINLKEIEAVLGCKTTKLSPTKLFAPMDLDF
jgi:predicted Zn-dependent peptidase